MKKLLGQDIFYTATKKTRPEKKREKEKVHRQPVRFCVQRISVTWLGFGVMTWGTSAVDEKIERVSGKTPGRIGWHSVYRSHFGMS